MGGPGGNRPNAGPRWAPDRPKKRFTALGEIADKPKAAVKAHPLPAGYSVIYDRKMKAFNELSAAFGLAFIFSFRVLASQFESLKHAFTITVSLPPVPLHPAVTGEAPARAANG